MNEQEMRRLKRRWVMWVTAIISVGVLIQGLLYAQIRHQSDDTERLVAAQVAGTVLACQRGNEIRRAIRQLDPGHNTDPDATAITPCRDVARRLTGTDPGPIGDYIGD